MHTGRMRQKHHIFVFNSLVDISGTPPLRGPRFRDVWNLSEVIKAVYACFRIVDARVPSRSIPGSDMGFGDRGDIGRGFQPVSNLFNLEMKVLIQDLSHWARKAEVIASAKYARVPTDTSLLIDAEDSDSLVWLPPATSDSLGWEQRTNVSFQSRGGPCVRNALIVWLLLSCNHQKPCESALAFSFQVTGLSAGSH
jgi:hypothetical protein